MLDALLDALRRGAWRIAKDPEARKAAAEERLRFWAQRASMLRHKAAQEQNKRRAKRLQRRALRAAAREDAMRTMLESMGCRP